MKAAIVIRMACLIVIALYIELDYGRMASFVFSIIGVNVFLMPLLVAEWDQNGTSDFLKGKKKEDER